MTESNDRLSCINKCIVKNTFEIIVVSATGIFEFERRGIEHFNAVDDYGDVIQKSLNLSCINTHQNDETAIDSKDFELAMNSNLTFIIDRREGVITILSTVFKYLSRYNMWPVKVWWLSHNYTEKYNVRSFYTQQVVATVVHNLTKVDDIFIVDGHVLKIRDDEILMKSETFKSLKKHVESIGKDELENYDPTEISKKEKRKVYKLLTRRVYKKNLCDNMDIIKLTRKLNNILSELTQGYVIHIHSRSREITVLEDTLLSEYKLEYIANI